MISLPSMDLLGVPKGMNLFGTEDSLVVSQDVFEDLRSDSHIAPVSVTGLRVVVSPWLPEGTMMIVPQRRPEESEEDFRRRCVAIKECLK